MEKANGRVRNCSIDIFRYICAILVVAIHTRPLDDVNADLGFVFNRVLTRIAVPFFLAVAGYFYIQKLEKGEKPFFPYIKRILITYIIWSIIYFAVDFIQYDFSSIIHFAYYCAYHFVLIGSCYHFWFFIALILAVCFTTLAYKIKCKKLILPFSAVLYVIACLGSSYYNLGVQIPLLGNLISSDIFDTLRRIVLMGIPFFTSGCVTVKLREHTESKYSNRRLLLILAAALVIDLAEVYAVKMLKLNINITVTFFLYPVIIAILLILLRNPLPECKRTSSRCLVLANFTYYSHPLFIIILNTLSKNIDAVTITQTPKFILTLLLTCVFGLIICKVNNKYINYVVR